MVDLLGRQPPARRARSAGLRHVLRDIGVFEGDDIFEGRPIQVRFIWSGTRTRTPRWEQAFSADDGETWETNWIMDFTPVGGRA